MAATKAISSMASWTTVVGAAEQVKHQRTDIGENQGKGGSVVKQLGKNVILSVRVEIGLRNVVEVSV